MIYKPSSSGFMTLSINSQKITIIRKVNRNKMSKNNLPRVNVLSGQVNSILTRDT
jgi:hypothetical protein